jgi:hypothetical protein
VPSRGNIRDGCSPGVLCLLFGKVGVEALFKVYLTEYLLTVKGVLLIFPGYEWRCEVFVLRIILKNIEKL